MDIREFTINKIYTVFGIDKNQSVRLLYMGRKRKFSLSDQDNERWFRNVEVQISGENHNDHHFNKHYGASEGYTLKFVSLQREHNENGDVLILTQENRHVRVLSYYQFYDGIPVVRSYTKVENIFDKPLTLNIVSSFESVGIFSSEIYDWEREISIYIPHNMWQGECVWKKYSPHDLGMYQAFYFTSKRISVKNSSGWSTSEYLPMGMLEHKNGDTVLWQIENNGSWNWEISTIANRLYLLLNGPSSMENDWSKTLEAGESFDSVKSAIVYEENKDEAFAALTKYRRITRRKNQDNQNLPVVFNDYMNCLFGNPTTENEIPLIDIAARLGVEYYCIDCGWYDDGDWWTTVGEWLPAETRFSNGLKSLLDYIRSKGMIPGLWLEIEVMGIESKFAKKLPDSWFFIRNGKRVIDHGRYHLDFFNPEVVAYANSVVDRLVNEYGVGYIKNDYNINSGIGTEYKSCSCGDGLLKHNRAFLQWQQKLYQKYPSLVIENCASGGMRMDYATLALSSIQSVSDQVDYRKNAAIAANCATAVTPEQAAIWSYPMQKDNLEETVFNMVNSLLFRIHQSGDIAKIGEKCLHLIQEAIDCYKSIRKDIKEAVPLFLTNFSYYDAPYCAFALKIDRKIYIAVWNLDNEKDIEISLKESIQNISVLYPKEMETRFNFSNHTLKFYPNQRYQARLFSAEIV